MSYQFFLGKTFKSVTLTLLTAAVSFGATIYDSGVTALKATDPTQLGRISRDGNVSDWSTTKIFPGIVNPTTSYRYEVFSIPVSPFPYLQITFDDLSGTGFDFASAYLNSYNPNSTATNRGLDVNYLGDPGRSGNYFGNVPLTFQVVLPSKTSNLLVVVNDASGTTGAVGANFRIIVDGYYDTSFNDTNPVPEPATTALSGAGLALAALYAYRRKQNI